MKCLNKVSLTYDFDEDRVCLRGEISERQIILLWLTHRLARQLVVHLLHAARLPSHEQVPPDGGDRTGEHSLADDNDPVPTSAELQESRLVHAIQLRSDPKHVELTFQSESSVAIAQIALLLNDARKLLCGMRACFGEATWPCDVWCDDSAEALRGHTASVTLH